MTDYSRANQRKSLQANNFETQSPCVPTPHAKPLKTLMTLNFQQFQDVSLMTA